MSDDIEAVLVAAAQRCARMVDVLKRQGALRGRRAETAALAADLADLLHLGAEVCAGGWVADEQIAALTAHFDRVAAALLEEIKPCHEKTC
jgi:hypothetical protein